MAPLISLFGICAVVATAEQRQERSQPGCPSGEILVHRVQTPLCGTTFQSQPACFPNLQAATGAIDFSKFTELNKRLTPCVVNGNEAALEAPQAVRDKCFGPSISTVSFVFFHFR